MKNKTKTASKSAVNLRVKDLKSKRNPTRDNTKRAITQDVTVNKAKTQDKSYKWMDDYIRG
jgi:hypothetical protein